MARFKFLIDGVRGPCQGGQWTANQWVEATGELRAGTCGVHVLTPRGVLEYMMRGCATMHAELMTVEVEGESAPGPRGEEVHRRGRLLGPAPWDVATCRLLAADIAELALPVWARAVQGDPRPWLALTLAREAAAAELVADTPALASLLADRGDPITTDVLRAAGEQSWLASVAASGRGGLTPAASWAATAAHRACLHFPTGSVYAPTALVKATARAALDAGTSWEAIAERGVLYLERGPSAALLPIGADAIAGFPDRECAACRRMRPEMAFRDDEFCARCKYEHRGARFAGAVQGQFVARTDGLLRDLKVAADPDLRARTLAITTHDNAGEPCGSVVVPWEALQAIESSIERIRSARVGQQ